MNKCIRILPDPLINKTKAGEVMESLVSMVKDLMENSEEIFRNEAILRALFDCFERKKSKKV